MIKTAIIIITIIGIFSQATKNNSTDPSDGLSQFEEYITQFGRQYDNVDLYGKKFINFHTNSKHIENLNKGNEKNSVTFTHTQFSDMSPAEFKSQYLTFKPSKKSLLKATVGGYFSSKNSTVSSTPDSSNSAPHRNLKGSDGKLRNLANAPLSYDWRNYGAVGIVKNQGACGSCWAFTTVAIIESQYFIKYGTMYNLSEQQLMDCDYSNGGCFGGSNSKAFQYIQNSYGLETTYNYGRYLAYKGYCRANSNLGLAQVTGWYYPGTDEAYIKSYLWANGPIAVAINAAPLQYYSSGIINLNSYYCDPTNLDHSVLLVGYGTSNGLDYWIAKNSWGPYFGESGYFRIVRGYGSCGLNRLAITATVS